MEREVGVLQQNLQSPIGELLSYCNQKPIEINQLSNACREQLFFSHANFDKIENFLFYGNFFWVIKLILVPKEKFCLSKRQKCCPVQKSLHVENVSFYHQKYKQRTKSNFNKSKITHSNSQFLLNGRNFFDFRSGLSRVAE